MKNIVATFNAAAAISGSGPDSGSAVRETDGQVRGAMLKRGGPGSKDIPFARHPRRNREGLRIHSASRTGEHDAVGPCATLRCHYDFARLHCSQFGTS